MQLKAHAKINWSLFVLERLPNGYHALDMLMQSVALADTITLTTAKDISLALKGKVPVPNDHNNLAIRAATLLRDTYAVNAGVDITLDKQIPVGAGLGGGSADAAAVLYGLNILWALSIPADVLLMLAASLGADVPFCLAGGLARVGGIGEKITQLGGGPTVPLLIVQPSSSLATASVFSAYDVVHTSKSKQTDSRIDDAQKALCSGDIKALAISMHNDLQDVASHLLPEISTCIQTLASLGALRAQMTGSGSAVIGLFSSTQEAQEAYILCKNLWPRTFLTETHPHGISV